ncbi:MAG: VOC family protein [Clostridia bacterium]|nr:VOC family protein [Clostridia bacterium]
MYYNKIIPELDVRDIKKSLHFYQDILGFQLEYERREDKFVFLSLGEIQFMLQELDTQNNKWETGKLEYPFGRGINFQLEVKNVDCIYHNVLANHYDVTVDMEENWYRKDNELLGNREFLIMDPDGYLLRFSQDLGKKRV